MQWLRVLASTLDTRLEVADLLVLPNGTLEVGTVSSPIGGNNSAELIFRDLPFAANDPKEHLRGLVVLDGVVRVHGRTLSETFIRTSALFILITGARI